MIIDAIVARALYVDANFSYLNIILLNDFSHPKNLSTALLIFLYSSTLYGLGFLPFLGFTGMLGSQETVIVIGLGEAGNPLYEIFKSNDSFKVYGYNARKDVSPTSLKNYLRTLISSI
jgi:hypothetical protein